MQSMLRRFAVLSVLVIASVSSADVSPAPETPAVTAAGTWKLAVETAQGTGHPVFKLQQDGATIQGRYEGALGRAPVTGTLKGSELKLSFSVNLQGRSLALEYTGTIDGDRIKGTARFGEYGDAPFTGERTTN